jgi:hypothetical protein
MSPYDTWSREGLRCFWDFMLFKSFDYFRFLIIGK